MAENEQTAPKAAEADEEKRPARRSQTATEEREMRQRMEDAMDRENASSRVAGEETEEEGEREYIYVHSNRDDDRVVLMEHSPEHPGGQAFVGGPGVAVVGRSPLVEQKLYSGELIEVPPLPKTVKDANGNDVPNPWHPVVPTGSGEPPLVAQPGQPTPLNRRAINPDYWGDEGKKHVREIRRRQGQLPKMIVPDQGGTTPPGMPGSLAEIRERERLARSR